MPVLFCKTHEKKKLTAIGFSRITCLLKSAPISKKRPVTSLELQIPIGKSHRRRLAQNSYQNRVHGIGIIVKASVRIALG
jgi:hypothetical protein